MTLLRALDNQPMVENDDVLPTQLYTPQSCETPEKKLMMAVLFEAIRALRSHQTHVARDARIWFRSPDVDGPFTFLSVCDVLHLEPEGTRRWALGVDPHVIRTVVQMDAQVGHPRWHRRAS